MGSLFSGPPSAPAIPVIPPAATPATMATPEVAVAGQNQRAKAAAAAGAMTDGGTGPQALQPPKTAAATLLGGTS